MPYKNPKNCMHPGCPVLVAKGRFCQTHARGRDSFRNTAEWERLRIIVLTEEPICKVPGCKERSTEVDHIIPVPQGTHDRSNLQGMCKKHHSVKTRVEVSR